NEPLEEHRSVPTESPDQSMRSASLLNELMIECVGVLSTLSRHHELSDGEVTCMSLQRVRRETRIYTLDPDNRPAATIRSGDEMIVETWDAFEGVRDAALLSERTLRGPATGPIYVDDARPGDALKVEFISITPWGDAVHLVRPG